MPDLKVVFCWAEVSGYMAACFQELLTCKEIVPFFLAFASGRHDSNAAFSDTIAAELPCRLLEPSEKNDNALIQQVVFSKRPDVIVVCGWFHSPYRKLIKIAKKKGIAVVLTMDTPWLGRPRQWLGRILLRRLMHSVDMVLVTGERSWQYAIRLGVPQEKIRRGMYGVDHAKLSKCLTARQGAGEWPKSFLFAGRYVREKALGVLLEGYRKYVATVEGSGETPWPLVCCGSGPLAADLDQAPGVTNLGFLQPDAMHLQLIRAGVFVIPSLYDPWPLALVEACASGLPVIASEACGSSVELIRSEFSGYIVSTGSVTALADAMIRTNQEYDKLPDYGARASNFAAAYSTHAWVEKLKRILEGIKFPPRGT